MKKYGFIFPSIIILLLTQYQPYENRCPIPFNAYYFLVFFTVLATILFIKGKKVQV